MRGLVAVGGDGQVGVLVVRQPARGEKRNVLAGHGLLARKRRRVKGQADLAVVDRRGHRVDDLPLDRPDVLKRAFLGQHVIDAEEGAEELERKNKNQRLEVAYYGIRM